MKKYGFYIVLLFLYLLFLSKDSFFKIFNNEKEIKDYFCDTKTLTIKEDYDKLLQLFEIKDISSNIVFSRILERNMYEFESKITIMKGRKDNIKKGNLVLSEKGVIGLVDKTSSNTSEVILLTNPKINLSVKINDAYGILTSIDHKIYIKNVKINENINIGDSIYTSGLTNIPENILIGTVSNIKKDSLELEYILEVKITSDINHIKYVGVVTS